MRDLVVGRASGVGPEILNVPEGLNWVQLQHCAVGVLTDLFPEHTRQFQRAHGFRQFGSVDEDVAHVVGAGYAIGNATPSGRSRLVSAMDHALDAEVLIGGDAVVLESLRARTVVDIGTSPDLGRETTVGVAATWVPTRACTEEYPL